MSSHNLGQKRSTTSSHLQSDKDAEGENASRDVSRPVTGWRWFLAILSLYSTALLYGLDMTIAAAVQGTVIEAFPGSIDKLAWIGIGFPLGSVAVILPTGYAYGRFNIKYFYLLYVVLFEAGSALCGAAPTMDALIIGRVLAGIGGSGMYLGVLNYLSVFTSLRERSLYVALAGTVWGIGTILGPIVGGGFAASSATWRWAFYINICIFAVSLPAMLVYLPQYHPQPKVTFLSKLLSMDWLGIILNAAMYTTWVLVVTFGSGQWGWRDARTITLWVVFGVILVTFILTQYFSVGTTPERRLFPGQFLRHRSLVLFFISTASATTALFVSTYFIPLLFQFVYADSAMEAAVRLLPFIIILIFFMLLNGGLMPVLGYYFPWYTLGSIFVLIGGAVMITVDADTPVAKIYGYSVLVAVGTGATMQIAYSAASTKVELASVPAVVGFINTAQIGGGVIALGIAGSIFQSLSLKNLETALSGKGYSLDELRGAIAGAQSALFRSASPEIQRVAIDGIVHAIDKVYFMVVTAGAVLLLSSLAMKREKLSFNTDPGA